MQTIKNILNFNTNRILNTKKKYPNFFKPKTYNKNKLKLSYFNLENILGYRQAKFINKLHYWLTRCGKNVNNSPNKWIYNSLTEWARQLNCSISTIRRTVNVLEKQNLLLSKKMYAYRYNQTKWYTINYTKLSVIFSSKKKIINT